MIGRKHDTTFSSPSSSPYFSLMMMMTEEVPAIIHFANSSSAFFPEQKRLHFCCLFYDAVSNAHYMAPSVRIRVINELATGYDLGRGDGGLFKVYPYLCLDGLFKVH
jgi:hypothetical protein